VKVKWNIDLPSAAKSSRASENSPSSMPSPTYQWTNARLEYMRSNLWLSAFQASAIAVVLESMQLKYELATRYNKSPRKGYIHSAVNLGQITVRNQLWWLEADTNLETSWAPVDKLNGLLGLKRGDSSVNLLGDDVTPVEKACGHVLSVSGVTLDHLVVRLKARVGNLLNRVGFVGGPRGRDDRGIRNQGEVNSGVWHKVGLELV